MYKFLLVVHAIIAAAMVGTILMQRSEGGALGMGGGGGGALMSGRGAADALAKMTSVAGGFFIVTSLTLTMLSGAASTGGRSVMDLLPATQSAPATTAPASSAGCAVTRPSLTRSALIRSHSGAGHRVMLVGPLRSWSRWSRQLLTPTPTSRPNSQHNDTP